MSGHNNSAILSLSLSLSLSLLFSPIFTLPRLFSRSCVGGGRGEEVAFFLSSFSYSAIVAHNWRTAPDSFADRSFLIATIQPGVFQFCLPPDEYMFYRFNWAILPSLSAPEDRFRRWIFFSLSFSLSLFSLELDCYIRPWLRPRRFYIRFVLFRSCSMSKRIWLDLISWKLKKDYWRTVFSSCFE